MPTLSELADQYGAATERASRMANQGLITPEEYGTILNKLRGLLDAHTTFDLDSLRRSPPPQAQAPGDTPLPRPAPGQPTPMPRPDPRGSTWSERLPRQFDEEAARMEDVPMNSRNFSYDPAANEMQRGYLPAPGRTLPDNPAAPWKPIREQGT